MGTQGETAKRMRAGGEGALQTVEQARRLAEATEAKWNAALASVAPSPDLRARIAALFAAWSGDRVASLDDAMVAKIVGGEPAVVAGIAQEERRLLAADRQGRREEIAALLEVEQLREEVRADLTWRPAKSMGEDLRGSIEMRKIWATTCLRYRLSPVWIHGRKRGFAWARGRTAYNLVYYDGGFSVGSPQVLAEGTDERLCSTEVAS